MNRVLSITPATPGEPLGLNDAGVVAGKPKWRGWLHAGAAPAALLAGLLLVILAPADLRLAVAVYALSTVILFTVSATYHRFNWKPRTRAVMQRVDHSAIFVLIAGSYTAVGAAVVSGRAGTVMLLAAWAAAAIGIAARLFWTRAPKWLFTPVYLLFGLAALSVTPEVLAHGGGLVFALIVVGGLCYVAGATIFATRRPNPSPHWFGFHEVFHSFTLGGYLAHFVAILLVVTGAALA